MVGDDQKWIKEAGEIAVAKYGCKIFSKTLFHIPTGGLHDQSTFNHENFETKCAGETPCSLCLTSSALARSSLVSLAHGHKDADGQLHLPYNFV